MDEPVEDGDSDSGIDRLPVPAINRSSGTWLVTMVEPTFMAIVDRF